MQILQSMELKHQFVTCPYKFTLFQIQMKLFDYLLLELVKHKQKNKTKQKKSFIIELVWVFFIANISFIATHRHTRTTSFFSKLV